MSTLLSVNSFREVLKAEFERKRNRNPRYSLRAYARDLGLDVSNLSKIMQAKKGLSLPIAKRIAKSLDLDQAEANHFLNLVILEQAKNPARRQIAELEIERQRAASYFGSIEQDVFETLRSWEHYAVYCLVNAKLGKVNLAWLATKIERSQGETEEIVDRLVRISVLKRDGLRLVPATPHQKFTSQDRPILAVQEFHRSILAKASESISNLSPGERELSTTVMSFDAKNIVKAKEMIREFDLEFRNTFANDSVNSGVYSLAIQFFELAKI